MGVVVAATDDDLDRTVAVKVVTSFGEGGGSPRARARLLREARVLARISHPNVITVHEVGTVGEDVFVAMEYIDGGTLGEWVQRRERPWPELVRAWHAAGRGLEAAHEAALVHRDFKPANVLVSRDDRIVVTDFGIAGFADPISKSTAEDDLDGELTRPGATMGTPRYMAPEQHSRSDVDARSDQFSFCVSLWEAVYGTHPFDAGSLPALVAAVVDGRVQPVPTSSAAPSRLRRILERGLRLDPDERYPAMGQLLVDLEHLLGAGRRRRWTAGAALALGGVLAVGFVSGRQSTSVDDGCANARGDWAGIWDDDTRASVKAAFNEAQSEPLAQNWETFEAALDRYVAGANEAHTALCEAARVPEADPDLIETRRHCLQRARASLAALTRLIRGRDEAIVARALDTAADLPSVEICSSLAVSSKASRVPEELTDDVDIIETAVAEALAYGSAGAVEQGRRVLESHADLVESLGHAPTEALYHAALGSMYSPTDKARAEVEFRRAYVLATRSEDYQVALRAARLLATYATPPRVATFWGELAVAVSERAGIPMPFELSSARAIVARENGDLEDAEHWFLQAIEGASAASDLAGAHGNLGGFYGEQGRFEEAVEHTAKAVAFASEYYGPLHAQTLKWRVNVVGLDVLRGQYDRGVAGARALLEEQQAVLPPGHEALAITHGLIATGLRAQGRHADAREHAAESLRIHEQSSGEDSVRTLKAISALTADLANMGEDAEALALSERMLAVAGRVFPSSPEQKVHYVIRRAYLLGQADRIPEAAALLESSLVELAEIGESESTGSASLHATLGHWRLEQGELDEAREQLGHAQRLAEKSLLPASRTARLAEDLERLEEAE